MLSLFHVHIQIATSALKRTKYLPMIHPKYVYFVVAPVPGWPGPCMCPHPRQCTENPALPVKEQIFKQSGAEDIISSVIRGFTCVIFAYGQTGTGKTYTIMGKPSNSPRLGAPKHTRLSTESDQQCRYCIMTRSPCGRSPLLICASCPLASWPCLCLQWPRTTGD